MDDKIILFSDKEQCCGCNACVNVCPKNAISMQEDENGFTYPKIDESLCVRCSACKRVCGYQNMPAKNNPTEAYAVASRDDKLIMESASGGVFAEIARRWIKEGGIVYGCAMQKEQSDFEIKQIRVDRIENLIDLQGSKYVHSSMEDSYTKVKNDLKNNVKVLFSGTPCQIASLRKFVGDNDNLYTIDIICHGVPSQKFFRDFIKHYEQKLGGAIKEFFFRDKSKGQGMITRSLVECVSGTKTVIKPGGQLSYIHFFSKSFTYRKNCYTCPFAGRERISDMTIGDFWGFHSEYPNKSEKDGFTNKKGISCVLVNSDKGRYLFDMCKEQFYYFESKMDIVTKHNEQLNRPSHYSPIRETILGLYEKEGYKAVDNYFYKNFKKVIIKSYISNFLPKGLKQSVQRIKGIIKK